MSGAGARLNGGAIAATRKEDHPFASIEIECQWIAKKAMVEQHCARFQSGVAHVEQLASRAEQVPVEGEPVQAQLVDGIGLDECWQVVDLLFGRRRRRWWWSGAG